MELWDAYTRDGELTDQILVRDEPIPEGLYHLVSEVLVRHVDGSFLCMKRAACKKLYPGYYETTAGGSALRGEDQYQCVKRELWEETGIRCEKFEEVGRCVEDSSHSIFYEFVCVVDCEKDSIRFQEGETEGYRWMKPDEFLEYVDSDRAIDTQVERFREYFDRLKAEC